MAKAQVEHTESDADDMPSGAEDEVAGAQFENNEDGLVVNLSNVEALKYELLPNGNYNVIIEDNQYSKSKSSGKPKWDLKLNIVDGEYVNRKVFEMLSFSEGALPGTKTRLAVIAPELLEGDFKVNDPATIASLVGRQFKVRLGVQKAEADSGYEDRNQVKRWYAPEGSKAFV